MIVERTYQLDAEQADPEKLDVLGIRDLLLRLAEVQDERDRTRKLIDDISHRYTARILALGAQETAIRQNIQTWLERVNDGKAISFPDAGSAHLRKTTPKVTVTDRDLFEEWAETQGFIRTIVDDTRARHGALQTAQATGEIPPGCAITPAGTGLTVKA